jgi:hypothetical protein
LIFTWARFFLSLLCGGIMLIPLDIYYITIRATMVAYDPITYSGTYLAFADAWIHWLPFILIIGGLIGLWVQSKMRLPDEVFVG